MYDAHIERVSLMSEYGQAEAMCDKADFDATLAPTVSEHDQDVEDMWALIRCHADLCYNGAECDDVFERILARLESAEDERDAAIENMHIQMARAEAAEKRAQAAEAEAGTWREAAMKWRRTAYIVAPHADAISAAMESIGKGVLS